MSSEKYTALNRPQRNIQFISDLVVFIATQKHREWCCNGDATSTEVFVKPTMRAFHGELVVVVEATKKAGTATLTVSGKGLRKGSVQLHIDSKK